MDATPATESSGSPHDAGPGTALLPMSCAEAFDGLAHAHAQLIAAEVAELIAITTVADHYQITGDDVGEGLERMVSYGHDGTPLIGEFLAAELGPLLGISPGSAIARIGDALDLRHRLPRLWQSTVTGRVRVWQAMQVVGATQHLDLAAAQRIDGVLAIGLATNPWSRVLSALPGWIAQADPDAARDRAEAASQARYVRVSGIQDGHVALWGRVAAEDGIAFDNVLTELARALPARDAADCDADLDQRRAMALGDLARAAHGQDALPTHHLIVHISASDPAIVGLADDGSGEATVNSGPSTGVARIEKWGALLTERLPQFLAGSKVIVRPIIDPDIISPVDAYEVPAMMRFALEQRNPVDAFPFATKPARSCDMDHTQAYRSGGPGQTRMDNLGPLSRFPHRVKTHGGWQLDQPQSGVFEWTSPMGYRYLVTAAGTTAVHRVQPSSEAGPATEAA